MILKLLLDTMEEYIPNKEDKILIVFDDMIADMLINEKLSQIVTELFIGGKKPNISVVFITQCYFAVSKLHTNFIWKLQTNETLNK